MRCRGVFLGGLKATPPESAPLESEDTDRPLPYRTFEGVSLGPGDLNLPGVESCSCEEGRILDLTFSEMDLGLWKRSAGSSARVLKGFANLGRKWGGVFGLYREHLPRRVKPLLEYVASCVSGNVCENCLIAYLKDVSRLCLAKIISEGMSDIIYLLDLSTLGGYDTLPNRTDPMSTIRAEFGTEAEIPMPHRLHYWIEKAVDKMKFRPLPCSFEAYVGFRDAWANEGASTYGKATNLAIDKGLKGVKNFKLRNKWFKALGKTDRMIYLDCIRPSRAQVKPFKKIDEPARSRTVQCFDTRSLIRTSYLGEAISSYNGREAWTTLEIGQVEKHKLRKSLLRKDGLWRLCIDQSGFDWHQWKEAVLAAFDAIVRRVVRYGGEDAAEVARIERIALVGAFLEVPTEGKMEWLKGVLSGMKWTALIDTILNFAETRYVMERIGAEVVEEWYQGDDVILKLRDSVCVSQVAREFKNMGLQVNWLKTWLSQSRCEFLHEIYAANAVWAFPARIMKSMIWSKPQTSSRGRVSSDIRQDLSILQKAARRRLVRLYPVARRLIKGVDRLADNESIMQCWHTPILFGGLGFGSRGRISMKIAVVAKRRFKFAVDCTINLKVSDARVRNHAIATRASDIVNFPGIQTTIEFSKIKGAECMPVKTSIGLAGRTKPCITWSIRDLRKYPDAYSRKLTFEWKLASGEEILPSDFPRPVFSGVENFDAKIRTFIRLSRLVRINLESASWSAEPYFPIVMWGRRVWNGVCVAASTEGFLKRHNLDTTVSELLGAVWHHTRSQSISFGYFV